jgi:putative DNA primase/helicase
MSTPAIPSAARPSWSNGAIDKYLARDWAFTLLNGKDAFRKGWNTESPLSVDVLRRHRGNLGLRTGQASGVVVIDFDDMECLADYAERLPVTVEAISGGGGRHFYYRYVKPAKCKPAGKVINGADIKADGGCIVFPGSVHPNGNVYRWADGQSPDEIELADLPGWIAEAITPTPPTERRPPPAPRAVSGNGISKYCEAALTGELETVRTAAERTRNYTLNESAFKLGGLLHAGLDRATVESELLAAAMDCGLPEHEARATIRSGLAGGEANPREIPESNNGRTYGWTDEIGGVSKPAADTDSKPKSDPAFIEYQLPMDLARHFLEHRYTAGRDSHLIRHSEDWYRYGGIFWELLEDERISAQVAKHFDGLWTPKRDNSGKPVLDTTGNPVDVKVRNNRSTVGETLFAIKACGTLVSHNPPCWLPGGDPAVNVMPCRNGLLDVGTGEITPLAAKLFCTWGLDFDYQPDAPVPEAWLTFLRQLWADDLQSIEVLQEIFGLALTADTRYHKIFLICGPKRGGKGTIGRVLTSMLGKGNVASPTLAGLATNFGLQCLIEKPLAIISDARLSGRTDQAVVVERLLSISGEDAQTIDRKHQTPITLTLPTRFLVLTNELPRLSDSSGAMASRFIILKLRESFLGREDHGLTARLLTELPGILNWSIEGLRRLETRGRFVQPDSAAQDIQELETLGSPVAAFVNEMCTVGAGHVIAVKALFSAWIEWCKDNGREHTGDAATFARNLRAAFPGIETKQRRDNGRVIRTFEGISYGN